MRGLVLSALVSCGLGGPLLAEDLGPAFAGYSVQGMAGLGSPSGQAFEIGTLTGTLDFENDEAILEHAALHCLGSLTADAQGQCVFTIPAPGGAREQNPIKTGNGVDETAHEIADEGEGEEDGLARLWTTYTCGPSAPEDLPADAPFAQSCTLAVTEGDGVFEGATGTATAIVVPPSVYHPDGSASAYAVISSFDLLLAP